MKIPLALTLFALLASTSREPVQPPNRAEQHEWLQQFVGDWKQTTTATDPGGQSMTWESRERIRAVGTYWTVAEVNIEEESFTSILTLGYDTNLEVFVGSWIDTNQPRLIIFEGQLDDDKRILTYGGEGPSFVEPGKMAQYREQLEVLAPDHKRTTSSLLGSDGIWITYMTVDARRVDG